MNHTESVAQVDAWLDHELDDDGQRQVYAHLAFCQECREYIQVVGAMRRGARDESLACPSSVDEAVLARIAGERAGRTGREWMRTMRLPLAAAAILAIIGVSLTIGHRLGAASESTRWEQEMGVYYQIPAVEVVGYVNANDASTSRTQ